MKLKQQMDKICKNDPNFVIRQGILVFKPWNKTWEGVSENFSNMPQNVKRHIATDKHQHNCEVKRNVNNRKSLDQNDFQDNLKGI